ncbi:UDP-N-acetylmuramoyl-L-alanine--D-glutamate ligase [Actinomadura madurae]|uniref:UDP-N-acetylmuramoyl-L-alanine--D-glutamate ligase n=1 Tax=Actinomadura madurae TaxID=1993 RepID=UPI0020268F70|nr:UDP-N-acetylmuramoyl-L-alanine--D-glutamate ligase [Actinomadura madurae]MCP9954976.1 UDP-N-acetylmuramoyl-L-alanine--D-glutamate ligase [Actinomadura madurae]MCQ0004235.1 UDP-N-acetylmuramoyl-L-alanine--D-glutamate ligase [Actinomadura madurae]URN02605.1 UDP-N-acetylmuramoyl-L-alanine--D-glutamate ligase [Actinomadura madurae]
MDAEEVSDRPWDGLPVCVAGLGVSGRAAARALAARGARVTVVDARDGEEQRGHAAELEARGVAVRLGDGESLPAGTGLVVTSPGWRPDVPLLAAAAEAGVEIIGEVELAWRLRPAGAAPWLAITGTDGKTTAVRMLACMLTAAGHRALAVGNVGTPIVEAVGEDHDVLAVELSSYQLHWSDSLAPRAAAVLNIAPDHLDWHGSMDAYVAAKAKIFAPGCVAVYNADDATSAALAERAGGVRRRAGFTLEVPRPGELGVVEELLVDRAFTADPAREAAELAALADVRPFAPHNVANALAAAALARAFGVPPEAVRAGLRAFVPDPHRIQHVADVAGVAYVNDSKATQPHAAAASLAAYEPVVWIAGGLLKGLDVDDLVRSCAGRLRGVVLMGRDRHRIAEALARHAPDVPVVDVPDTDTGAMDRVVTEASGLARPGDTVLLAPVGASFDMFANYPARGDAFIASVERLAEGARPGRGDDSRNPR